MLIPASAAWLMLAYRRRRRLPVRRAITTATLDVAIALWGAWVSLLVTMPTTGESSVHLLPGTDLLVATSEREAFWQATANFSLLLPLGMLLPMRSVRWRSTRRITAAAFVTSCGIELTQYIAGIGRVTSADDVLINTTGAATGATVALLIINRRRVPDFSGAVAAPGTRPGPNSRLWTIGAVDPLPPRPVPAPRTPGSASSGRAPAHTTRWNAGAGARKRTTAGTAMQDTRG